LLEECHLSLQQGERKISTLLRRMSGCAREGFVKGRQTERQTNRMTKRGPIQHS
jgi:hypothetical protein